MMTPEQFEQQLIRHEGCELQMYTCPAGHLTIGVGHNLEANPITKEAALHILRDDIAILATELANHYPIVCDLDDVRYYVLVNMVFNLGIVKLSKFKRMWAYISSGDYASASLEMLDSKWATQVGKRATELSEMMRTGEYKQDNV